MNKTLALYFDDESIIGAVEPFDGKFSVLQKRDIRRFFLYFFVDGSDVRYGWNYRQDFFQNKPNTYGDIYEHVQVPERTFSLHGYKQPFTALIDKVLVDVKDLYYQRLDELSALALSRSEAIPLTVAFSDSIPVSARKILIAHLNQTGFRYTPQGSLPALPELIVRRLIRTKKIPAYANVYGVVEALNRNLNVSLVDIDEAGTLKRSKFETYPGYGTDPRVEVIAKYVVDEINGSWNFLNSQADKEKEYKRQFEFARQWNDKLSRSMRPYVDVKACLTVAPNSPTVITINKETIDELTRLHSLEISRFFERTAGQKLDELANILTIGGTLHNLQVIHGFNRFGKDRIIQLTDDFVYETISELLKEQSGREMFPLSQAEEMDLAVQIIKSAELSPGQKIAFRWKKNRLVVAEYLGKYQYRIIRHEESKVITDDTFVMDQIELGQPVVLREVYRPGLGKKLGVYNSGAAITSLKRIG